MKVNYGNFLTARAIGGKTSATIWMQQFEAVATSFSSAPELTVLADDLVSSIDNLKAVHQGRMQGVMQRQFEQFLNSGIFLNVLLISADQTVIFDALGQSVGKTFDAGGGTDAFAQMWSGEPVITSVHSSDLSADYELTFYAAAPLHTSSGEIVAGLLLQLPPGRALFPIISGPPNPFITTYIVDEYGKIISSTGSEDYSTLAVGQTAYEKGTSLIKPVGEMLTGIDNGTLAAPFDSAAGPLLAAWSWIEPLKVGILVTMPPEIPMWLIKQIWAIIAASAATTSFLIIYFWIYRTSAKRRILFEQELFAAAGEATPDAYIVVDSAGHVRATNAAFQSLFGWTGKKVNGIPLQCLLRFRAKTSDSEIVEVNLSHLDGKNLVTGLARDKFNNELPVGLRAARLKSLNGSIFVIHDHRSLEKRDAELRHALAEARAALNAKSRFLSTISHELRSPVASIIAALELIGEELEDSEHFDVVEQTQRSAHLLLGIVEDILEFSSLRAGRISLRSAPFLLPETLEDVCNVLDWQARRNDVLISRHVDNKIPVVFGDAPRVRQILLNLLGNAIKFSTKTGRPGSVVVDILGIRHGVKRVVVDIVIRDNGIGMSRETLDRIFVPFEQADSSIKRKYGGTGLGLSITKRLVEEMHGKISVESTEGFGTTFTVRLIFPTDPERKSEKFRLATELNNHSNSNNTYHDPGHQAGDRDHIFYSDCDLATCSTTPQFDARKNNSALGWRHV